jgi:hypothetical protein
MDLYIITHYTIGLLADANLYKKYFKKYDYEVKIMLVNYNTDIYTKTNKPFKIKSKSDRQVSLLFLENIPDNIKQYKSIYKSKYNLFMPNQELFQDKSYPSLKYIDFVLCKTQLAVNMFEYVKTEHKFNYQVVYTKFSTIIPQFVKLNIIKDPNLFVLLAGTSPYKNTALLVYNWIQNNGYLDYDVDKQVKLYITCTGRCFTTLLDDLVNYMKYNIGKTWTKTITDSGEEYTFKNLTLYNKVLNDRDYNHLLSCANVVICPSSKEGYGHNINQARYFNTYVITVDAAPMNELIFDGDNGALIRKLEKDPKKSKFTKFTLYSVYPNLDELTKKIAYCVKHKYDLKINSKKYYLADLAYFKNTIAGLANQLLVD